jgi:hypothetical protein
MSIYVTAILKTIIMLTFINTGINQTPFTTVDDTDVYCQECDNGVSWTLDFMLNNERIDLINLEYVTLYTKMDYWVLRMQVRDSEGKLTGKNVQERMLEVHAYDNKYN